MKKDSVKTRNQIANLFYDLADISGISKAVRDRLRKIGDEISNYRQKVLSESSANDLYWLGENIRDFIDPENLRIMDNFAAEVRKVLLQQDDKQEGGKIMGLLDKLRGKNQITVKDDKETQKAKKNIFLAQQLIEKNITMMEEENKKILDILDQASREPKDSPRYAILQGEWQLAKDRIKTCGTKMTLAFNTLKVNSKMVDAMDIFTTSKLLERMMPNSKKAEKLMNKAMEKTEDLADMQDDMTALLEDALDEMNSTVSTPTSDQTFEKAVSQQRTVIHKDLVEDTSTLDDSVIQENKSESSLSSDNSSDITEEQINQFLSEA